VSRRLRFAVDDAFHGLGRNGYLASIRPELAALDRAAVDAAIGRHLASDGIYMVFITADAEALKELLLSGEGTYITYSSEPPPEITQEDHEIANFPIDVAEEDVRILDISEVFEGG
jgi:hypothetical protein